MTTLSDKKFLVYRASAGSGKTYTLVSMYILCCLEKSNADYFRHILAITFTNKAAGEMKKRVMKYLEEIPQGKHAEMLQFFVEQTGKSAEELKSQLQAIHKTMLHRYGEVSIMTIDRFVNKLIRSFYKDLGLDADYRIELDQARITGSAVDQLLSKVGEDALLTNILEHYVSDLVEDEKSWKVKTVLDDFAGNIYKESVQSFLDHMREKSPSSLLAAQGEVKKDIAKQIATWRSLAASAFEIIRKHGVEHCYNRNSLPKYLRAVADGDIKMPSPSLLKEFENGEFVVPQKITGLDRERTEEAAAALIDAFGELMESMSEEEVGAHLLLQRLSKKIYQMAVLSQLENEAKKYQEQQNVKTFSDLNAMISDLVRNNPAPFVFERIGQRYHHFLIDEFQDTSIVQWQNLLPLFEEALAGGHLNLIVGDGKQAIYRWRNGDVQQFQNMPKLVDPNPTPDMRAREQVLKMHHEDKYLETNYRSHAQVVEFNNALYLALAEHLSDDFKSIYTKQEQLVNHKNEGFVQLNGVFGKTVPERMEMRHQQMIESVHRLKSAGVALNDIALLFRTNKEAAAAANALLENGIQPITEESLLLQNHPGVHAVMSFLGFLVNRNDDRAKVQFISSLSQMGNALNELEVFEKYTVFTKHSKPKGSDRIRSHFDLQTFLDEQIPALNQAGLADKQLYELIELLLSVLGVYEKAPAYAEALLQLVLDYNAQDQEGISGLLKHWELKKNKASIRVTEGSEGVRLFTVHKSKGLEFPYVIYPMAFSSWWDVRGDLPIHLDKPIHGLQKALLPAKQGMGGSAIQAQYDLEAERLLLDELNTTYVATTRAEKGLIVILELKDDQAKGTSGRFRIPEMVFHWAKERFADFQKDYRVVIGEIHPKENKEKHQPEKNESPRKRIFERGPLSERLKLAFDKDLRLLREGKLNAQEIGNEVHFGLAQVKDLSEFSAYKSREFPWVRMDEDDWKKILEQMENVLHHPKCKEWFSKDHRAIVERSLITPEGEELRPDRVVFMEDHIAIIDFKTGAKKTSHEKQIRQYIKALEALEEKAIRGFLVYSDEMVVEEVSREEGQTSLF
ncbi:MAG: UvrD-helicase domain-containing protein [Flavobacteriales bacterium]|nr:UvrD-helicase domain-containing protein [Flavobacteriales bacterium]